MRAIKLPNWERVAFCWLPLTMSVLRAQDIPLTLSMNLTSTIQGSENGGNPVNKVSASTIRISTKDILKLFAQGTYSGEFPVGTKLSLSEGSISVVDKSGRALVSDIATVNTWTVV